MVTRPSPSSLVTRLTNRTLSGGISDYAGGLEVTYSSPNSGAVIVINNITTTSGGTTVTETVSGSDSNDTIGVVTTVISSDTGETVSGSDNGSTTSVDSSSRTYSVLEITASSDETVSSGDTSDEIVVFNLMAVDAGAGDDYILSTGYLVTLDGGADNDIIQVVNSYVMASGGTGDDTLIVETESQDINIANVTLHGGDGADVFEFLPGSHTIDVVIDDFNPDEGDRLILVRNLSSGTINSSNDTQSSGYDPGNIKPQNLSVDDVRRAEGEGVVQEGFSLSTIPADSESSSGVAILSSSKLGMTFRFRGVDSVSDLQNISFSYLNLYSDGTESLTAGGTFGDIDLPDQIANGLSEYYSSTYEQNWLYVYSAFDRNIWLSGFDWNGNAADGYSDTTVYDLHAEEDTVSGRMLGGNDLDNYIYAGSGGASLWGGATGRDNLYGGDGADTFIAAATDNESYTAIRDVGEEDIVYLDSLSSANIFSSDSDTRIYINGLSSGSNSESAWRSYFSSSYINFYSKDWSSGAPDIYVYRKTDATTTTFQFNDGYKIQYNYDDESWYVIDDGAWKPYALTIGQLNMYTDADGHNVLQVYSDYPHYVDTGLDYFSSVDIIDGSQDTVNNRSFSGNSKDNTIYAGTNGSWLYGGDGGDDILIGGAGADTFQAASWSNATIIDCANDDLVYLPDINLEDLSGINVSNDENGNASVINMTTTAGTVIQIRQSTDANITNIQLGDESQWRYDRNATGEWWNQWALVTNPIPDGLSKSGSSLYVYSSYGGNLYLGGVDWNGDTIDGWFDESIYYVYDYGYTAGRILAGNSNSNNIHANNYGALMWGGNGGSDWLYGGTGADTYIAGMNEGNVYIDNCDDNDIVVLYNIAPSDIVSVSSSSGSLYNNIRLTTTGGDQIVVWSDVDTISTTRFRMADGTDTVYSHVLGRWLSDSDIGDSGTGLTTIGNTVYIYSSYANSTFDLSSLSSIDSALVNIDARNDTHTAFRTLKGDSRNNVIRAGGHSSSLTWMWGGGGNDILYGGTGSDFYQVGLHEGDVSIWYYEDQDTVYLYNISVSDIASISTYYGSTYNCFRMYQDDGSVIRIWYDPNTTSKLTFQFAGRAEVQYDIATGEWSDIPSGLTRVGNVLYVRSEYEGDVWLGGIDLDGNTVEGWTDESTRYLFAATGDNPDTVSGRMLAGNSLNNDIYAGSGGASLWGGVGGVDNLYGGAGDDTFIAGNDEGNVAIHDCSDNDLVFLHNITAEDIYLATVFSGYGADTLAMITNDNTGIFIGCSTDTTVTTIQYANGWGTQYNHVDGTWSDYYNEDWDDDDADADVDADADADGDSDWEEEEEEGDADADADADADGDSDEEFRGLGALQSSAALDYNELWGSGDVVHDLLLASLDDDPLGALLSVDGGVALNDTDWTASNLKFGDDSLIMKYAKDFHHQNNS